MASGRPQRPNDPSVISSLEAAVREIRRPGPLELVWNWRWELGILAAGAGLAKAGDANTVGESAVELAGVAGIVAVAAYVMKDGVASVTESPKFDCAPAFTATSSRPAKRTEIYFIASFPQTKECPTHYPYNFEG